MPFRCGTRPGRTRSFSPHRHVAGRSGTSSATRAPRSSCTTRCPGFEVCGVSIAGTVEIAPLASAAPLVELVHSRYMTAEGAADPAAAEFLESDDVALRLRPASALTWDERDSDASAALRRRRGALHLVPTEPRA